MNNSTNSLPLAPSGLGTSTSKEAKEYFSDMARHRIRFRYSGPEDDSGIMLAFNKNKINERKQWLTTWMEEKRRRTELGLPEDYLYGAGTHAITYHDFIHKELVLFSNMDNERSIPSLVDGLKPGQRKVRLCLPFVSQWAYFTPLPRWSLFRLWPNYGA